MNACLAALSCLLISAALSFAAATSKSSVTLQDITEGKVSLIGALGVPLLEVVEIDAELVTDDPKAGAPRSIPRHLLLKVSTVNGRPRVGEPTMRFQTFGHLDHGLDVTIRRSEEELYELENGNPGPGASVDWEKLRNERVGSRHRLLAYEVAYITGPAVPEDPDQTPIQLPWYSSTSGQLHVVAEFPQEALNHPADVNDVVVEKLDRPVPTGTDAFDRFLKRLGHRPEVNRFSALRPAQWREMSALFRNALLAKARKRGFDADTLALCIDSPSVEPTSEARIPVAAYASADNDEPMWIIVWKEPTSSDKSRLASPFVDAEGRPIPEVWTCWRRTEVFPDNQRAIARSLADEAATASQLRPANPAQSAQTSAR